MSATPLVSAITIFLDGARFLPESIESVLAQTYPEWELLLVDDGSTDGVSDIARRYAADHPGRIHYLEHEGRRNRGMSASRNLGLHHARGEFVAFLDGDDVWLPTKLERQVGILSTHPEVDMVVGATRVWFGWTGSGEDKARDTIRTVVHDADGVRMPPELLRRFLRAEALTPATCSVMLRRRAIEATGGFEERFRGLYEDQAFFMKAYLKLVCHVSSDVHDLYRQHPGSHSAVALASGVYSTDHPTRAMTALYLWWAGYLVRARVTDRGIWTALIGLLAGISRYWASVGASALLGRTPGGSAGSPDPGAPTTGGEP